MKILSVLVFLFLTGCASSTATVPNECSVLTDSKHKVTLIICDKDTEVNAQRSLWPGR